MRLRWVVVEVIQQQSSHRGVVRAMQLHVLGTGRTFLCTDRQIEKEANSNKTYLCLRFKTAHDDAERPDSHKEPQKADNTSRHRRISPPTTDKMATKQAGRKHASEQTGRKRGHAL